MDKLSDNWAIRFWGKVDKQTECWNWCAGRDKDGYGKFAIGGHGNQKHFRAHRLSWYLATGFMPLKHELVLHKCDNTSCVNPNHLFLGNQKDNVLDALIKGRHSVLPGSKHPRNKLVESQVKEIRNSNSKDSELAAIYNVSVSTIQNIRSGRQWRQLL